MKDFEQLDGAQERRLTKQGQESANEQTTVATKSQCNPCHADKSGLSTCTAVPGKIGTVSAHSDEQAHQN